MGTTVDSFISLVYSVINDAVDLFAERPKQMILANDGLNQMMEAAESYDPSFKPSILAFNSSNLGVHAAYVVEQVYGMEDLTGAIVPRTVYFRGIQKVSLDDIEKTVRKENSGMTNKETIYRDKYNLALSLVVSLWVRDFEGSGYRLTSPPKEGVYPRDKNGDLYLYAEGKR